MHPETLVALEILEHKVQPELLVPRDEVEQKETEEPLATQAALDLLARPETTDLWDHQVQRAIVETLDHPEPTVAQEKMEQQEQKEIADSMGPLDVMGTQAPLETLEPQVLLEKMGLLARDLLDLLDLPEKKGQLDPVDHPAPLVLMVSRESKDPLENLSMLMTALRVHQVDQETLVSPASLELTSS